jgi:ribose transport system substrate-binding protein
MEVEVRKHLKILGVVLTVGAAAALLAVSAAAAPTKTAHASRAAACGAIPNVAPADPSNLLPKLKLTKAQLRDYTGWGHTLLASAWAKWKPTHKPPYKVAVVWSQPANGFNDYNYHLIQKFLKRSPLISSVTATQAASATAIPDQLQQYNAAVQSKPDLIIFSPLAPPAATAAVEAAGKQGIPTVSVYNNIDTPYAVSIAANPYLNGATMASGLVKALGGSGNVLEILGSPQAGTTIDEQAAWKTIFGDCSGIKVLGQALGFFATALAKQNTVQFLATHPDKVDGAIETAAMAQGVVQAFLQSGRPMPVIADGQASKSLGAYWKANASKGYKAVSIVGGATQFASLATSVALRILDGQGPKINYIPWRFHSASAAELKTLVNSSWTTDTAGAIELPKKYWWTSADLNRLFNHPNLRKGVNY